MPKLIKDILGEKSINLKYDPDSGDLIQTKNYSRRAIGEVAGFSTGNGYITVSIQGSHFLAHRVAWFLYYGEDPIGFIDHTDRDKRNNRIINLRLTDKSGNERNTTKRRTNTSGYKGVSLHKLSNLYRATITNEGKHINLGYFKSPEEASLAYETFAKEHHKEFYYKGVL